MKRRGHNFAPRILITLLGLALIIWGAGTPILGIVGARDTAVITSIRRQGGERDEAIPGRYTYSIGYTFTLPEGKQVDGSTTKLAGAAFIKPDGSSTAPVRYLVCAPFINVLEAETKPTIGNLMTVGIGILMIVLINRKGQGQRSR